MNVIGAPVRSWRYSDICPHERFIKLPNTFANAFSIKDIHNPEAVEKRGDSPTNGKNDVYYGIIPLHPIQ